MRHRAVARLTTVLALVAASIAWALPARAAVDGFDVNVGQQPGTFTIGKAARTLTAVITTDRADGRRCHKVRWALTVRTDGISLDQIRIDRVENGGTFRTRTQVGADQARVVDVQADPGTLCRGQTVTGRWDIGFAGPDSGTVTFQAAALEGPRELAAASVTSRVVSPVAATPSASPAETGTASPDDQATDEPVGDDDTPVGDATSSAALNPAAGTPSVLGPGLIIGAALVFLGVALLLRLRTRNRREPAWQSSTQTLPTGFYNAPRRRKR